MEDADRVTDLLIALREAGIQLAEFSVQKPTLDEVFLTITNNGEKDNVTTTSDKLEQKGKVRV
jgi:ABC-2 type transport system ATP-binding protein